MGEVYKALDTRLNRFVAIKVLSTGASAKATQAVADELVARIEAASLAGAERSVA